MLANRGMGPMTTKFVSLLALKALEWLEHSTSSSCFKRRQNQLTLHTATVRNEARRHSAALILYQLAKHQPMHVFHYVPKIFSFIFIVLYDVKVCLAKSSTSPLISTQLPVRLAGLKTLKQGLSIWRGRSLYPTVYRKIEQGFNEGKEET